MAYVYVLSTMVNGVKTIIPRVYTLEEIEDMGCSSAIFPAGTQALEIDCGDGTAEGYEDILLDQVLESVTPQMLLPYDAESFFVQIRRHTRFG